jgi:hypothetical protein
MADKERITDPSSGSNELGKETQETHPETGISAGTDTQLHIAALSGKKHRKNKDINDDEKVMKNPTSENRFLQSDETDE